MDVRLVTALLANTLLVACEAIDNGEAALQPTVDVGLCFQLCQRLAEIAMGLEHLNNGHDRMNLFAHAVCKMPGAQLLPTPA